MYFVYIVSGVLLAIGIYAIVFKDNMIKKIIGMGIMSQAVHIFIINIGHKTGGIAPIMTADNIASFAFLSVDPLPQALVLTSIVIDFGISVLALSIIVMLYKHSNSLSSKISSRMKG